MRATAFSLPAGRVRAQNARIGPRGTVPILAPSGRRHLQSAGLEVCENALRASAHGVLEGRSAIGPGRCLSSAKASGGASAAADEAPKALNLSQQTLLVGGLGALTLGLSVSNRLLYKVALNGSIGEYVFFLAQLCTFSYIIIYFCILAIRYKSGIVTKEMMALPKKRFAFIGAMEALSLTLGLFAARQLPGTLLPIFAQTMLLWNLLVSRVLLKKTFSFVQLVTVSMVAIGAAICGTASASGSLAASLSGDAGFKLAVFSAVFICSHAPIALAVVSKEKLFADGKRLLGEKGVDIFVVNSFCSLFQGIFIFALLPLLASLKGISVTQLPQYLRDGFATLVGEPLAPVTYVLINVLFNITALQFLKMSSTMAVSLTIGLSVPLTVLAFSFPPTFLPLVAAPISSSFGIGLFVLMGGLIGWNIESDRRKRKVE